MAGGQALGLGGVGLEVPGVLQRLLGVAGTDVAPHGVLGGEGGPGLGAVGALEPGALLAAQHEGAPAARHVLLQRVLEVVSSSLSSP